MATAYKCDVCEEYYDDHSRNSGGGASDLKSNVLHILNFYVNASITERREEQTTSGRYPDLCSNCIKKIMELSVIAGFERK